MSGTNQCFAARVSLGDAVRNARIKMCVSQDQLAKKCGWSQAKIQKIEKANQATTVGDVDTLVGVLGIDESKAEEMRAWARASRELRRGLSTPPSYFLWFLHAEPQAAEIRAWHSERMPGPLQSEHYMVAQYTHAGADDITESMRQRRGRRGIVTGPRPPLYRVVLSESALRRVPGGRRNQSAIIVDQAEHLIRLTSECRRLQLQVLPFYANIPYVPGDFTTMTFDPQQPLSANAEVEELSLQPFVYLEHAHHGSYLKKSQELKAYRATWDGLSEAALSEQESWLFLQDLAKEHREQLGYDSTSQWLRRSG